MDEFTEVGLAANETVGDLLLAAKGGQVNDGLDGVDVMGYDDKLSL